MSDTPRVDAAVKAGDYFTNTRALSELAMLARNLERELAAERQRAEQAEQTIAIAKELVALMNVKTEGL